MEVNLDCPKEFLRGILVREILIFPASDCCSTLTETTKA